jgi:surface antigen
MSRPSIPPAVCFSRSYCLLGRPQLPPDEEETLMRPDESASLGLVLPRRCLSRIGALLATAATLAMIAPAVGGTSAAYGSQTECFSYGYSCTPGYDATNAAGGWAWKYYGGSYAETPTGYHNCTLYAAWRLEQNGLGNPGLWGNAFEWINHTSHNNTPAVGAIAWWGSEVGGGFGHVAYVEQIRGSEVFLRADNYAGGGGYTDSGWIPASSADAFLHPHDLQTGPPGEGAFVGHDGFVYRIAGGAPVYVSNWNAVGGPQAVVPLSDGEFAALPEYPRDGSILDGSGGKVFVVAGGAPLYLSNWNAIGGPKPGTEVDEAAIDNAGGGVPWDHLRGYPADGTLLDSSGGGVFVAAGGAPLYLSNWNAIGGPKPGVAVDQWDIDNVANPAAHLNAVPANGTLIASTATGMVYEIAGGAPLYVSNWAAIGGARPAVSVDQWDLDNITNPAAHLNPVPANGTILGASGGGVFIVAGGAPLYLSNWAAIGGPQPYVPIDQWDIDNLSNPAAHLNPVPSDGTFINTSTGHVYRIAGGAPFAVSSWSVFGGMQPYATVDEWDIENTTNPAAHLNSTPANGTIVEGLPSQTYWSFTAGLRTEVLPVQGVTTVDDVGLSAFPRPTPLATQTKSSPAGLGPSSPVTSPPPSPTPSRGVLATKTTRPANGSSVLSRALAKCRRLKNHHKRASCIARAKKHFGPEHSHLGGRAGGRR